MRKYLFPMVILVLGVLFDVLLPLTPTGRGLLLGVILGFVIPDFIAVRLEGLTVADVLPKDLSKRRRVVITSFFFGLCAAIASLSWLATHAFAGDDQAFVGSLVASFFLVIGAIVEILALGIALMKGVIREADE